MIRFDFSLDVISQVINELDEAGEYIRIANFQIHNDRVFNILEKKIEQGLIVEILTLPYDSININDPSIVIKQFQSLLQKGAKLHFCKWNIGDPQRTSTAIGKWYSFHGKFIITDKAAISLTANFTYQDELDVILIYKFDQDKINEFNNKFDQLLDIFIHPHNGYSGKIRSLIMSTSYPDPEKLFNLPGVIETDTHKDHWILDYPSELCPTEVDIDDKLYICPLDIRSRNIIQKLIKNSKNYLYISTESFTDQDICDDLIQAKLEGIDIRILTGAISMDFSDRMQKMLRSLLASGIKINTCEDPLHAKLLISDTHVAVSSINLNKMNLGFRRAANLWRGNTETITISSNFEVVNYAKRLFETFLLESNDITIKLAERIERDVGKMFTKFYGVRSSRDVKRLFSRFIIKEEVDVKRITLKIGKIAKHIISSRTVIEKKDYIMAMILHFLSDNKLNYNQIENKLSYLNTTFNLEELLTELEIRGYIEIEDEYYKLKVLALF